MTREQALDCAVRSTLPEFLLNSFGASWVTDTDIRESLSPSEVIRIKRAFEKVIHG